MELTEIGVVAVLKAT